MDSELDQSAAISLGLKKKSTPRNLFTPSPLITPNTRARPTIKRAHLAINNLLDFDHQLLPTASIDSIPQIKIENYNQNIIISPNLPILQQNQSNKEQEYLEPLKRITRKNKAKTQVKIEYVEQVCEAPKFIRIEKRGRKRMYGNLEQLLALQLQKKSMNRLQIQQYAKKWGKIHCREFTASNGWYEKFINRLRKSHPELIQNVSKTDNFQKRKIKQKKSKRIHKLID